MTYDNAFDRARHGTRPAHSQPESIHPLVGRLLNMARWQRENMHKHGQNGQFNSFANGSLAQEAADAILALSRPNGETP